jgi:hypothetical protein
MHRDHQAVYLTLVADDGRDHEIGTTRALHQGTVRRDDMSATIFTPI